LLIGNEVGEMKSFMIEVVEGVLLVETVEWCIDESLIGIVVGNEVGETSSFTFEVE
jgi:hypothetical protein